MPLSNEIVSEFVKVTRDYIENKTETTLFGTIVVQDNSKYVRIDGSDLLTPVTLTADVQNNERVTVLIKDHAAIVTGNISSPSARTDDVQEVGNRITNAEILIADKVSTGELEAATAQINEKLIAHEATIASLEADNVNIHKKITAHETEIKASNTNIDALKSEYGKFKTQTSNNITAIVNEMTALESRVSALEATVKKLTESQSSKE